MRSTEELEKRKSPVIAFQRASWYNSIWVFVGLSERDGHHLSSLTSDNFGL